MNYIFRQAKIDEADKLTELAFLLKASWGYPQEWMDAWKDELTITPEIIKNSISVVAEYKNEIVGFWCRPKIKSEEPTFGFLFIHPEHMGKGLAKALWKELSKKLIQNGIRSFTIIADPNAVPFYLKLGAVQIGMQDSKTIPGRKIPILKFTLDTE